MGLRSSGFVRLSPRFLVALALSTAAVWAGGSGGALAQDLVPSILSPGDAIVTGFSGIVPPDPPPAAGVDPLDETFIDTAGASMRIMRLQPPGPPTGQLIPSATIFSAKASDVGQVFAVTLDDAAAPNIYLGATSAFGLQIVTPDSDANGKPQRAKTGQAGATFMEGQWGLGGSPGSIYKVDGSSGQVSLFTTIGADNGPGIGDLVYDPVSHQFFASDLDSGLIYRLDSTGKILDTFDHGVNGRPAHSLAAVPDDGSDMDITNAAFNAEDPSTWGYTQKERMVWGMAMHNGRLYYAVADGPQVWSIRINLDGTFAGDPRWELDVTGLASTNAISDMLFDGAGRMVLAQRGPQVGSYDYTVFATPQQSEVVRYQRENPDDPSTPSAWVATPESYAIGFRPDGNNASGGVALGYAYDEHGYARQNACGQTLWATGDSLREDPTKASELAAGGEAIVHGIQGNDRDLVRPQNDPPTQSYFADYDGTFGDAADQGHLGDVETYNPCQGEGGTGFYYPPQLPPDFVPPPPATVNLTLQKQATPGDCAQNGAGFQCNYTVRVKNTGNVAFGGPIVVNESMPALPPGAVVTFSAPWACGNLGPGQFQCTFPPSILSPGDSDDLNVAVGLPATTQLCFLNNAAEIDWRPGEGDANPNDDFDDASAHLVNPLCKPPTGKLTDLKIEKIAQPAACTLNGANWDCSFLVTVTNQGPGQFNGSIVVTETTALATFVSGSAPWNCVPAGPNVTCTLPPVSLGVGEPRSLLVKTTVPAATLTAANACTVQNEAAISQPAGGTDQNTSAGDDGKGVAKAPGPNCVTGKSDLSVTKEAFGCHDGGSAWFCTYKVTIKNEGPADFNDKITLTEATKPPPSSPTVSIGFFEPAWNCTTTATGANCSTVAPTVVPAGTSIAATAIISIDKSLIAVCKVDNDATIASPAAGTNGNSVGTNDHGHAEGLVPSATCNQVPTKQTNLKIEKTSSGDCTLVGDTVGCDYLVKISNTTAAEYKGPVELLDQIGAVGSVILAPDDPAWTCTSNPPAGFCILGTADLPGGAAATFKVHAETTLTVVQANSCKLENSARIIVPIVGFDNTIAADDQALNISGTLRADLCNKPATPTNLVIDKSAGTCVKVGTGGWDCTYEVKVTNAGPGQFATKIKLTETFPAGTTLATSSGNLPINLDGGCTGSDCTFQPSSIMKTGDTASFRAIVHTPDSFAYNPATCHVDNTATIVDPVNNSLNNVTSDDTKTATDTLPCQATNLSIVKTPKNCGPLGADFDCVYAVTITNTGAGPVAEPIVIEDSNPLIVNAAFPIGEDLSNVDCYTKSVPGKSVCILKAGLVAGAAFIIDEQLVVPGSFANLNQCKIGNAVSITSPINTNANSVPGDDSSFAIGKIDMVPIELPPFGTFMVPCDPPSLAIAKVANPAKCAPVGAGFECGYDVTVTSKGPDPYLGTLQIDETAPPGTTLKSVSAPWVCLLSGPNGHCTYDALPKQGNPPVPTFAVGQKVTAHVVVTVPGSFAREKQCSIVNTVATTVGAEVLHSDKAAQYQTTGAATLDSPLCRSPDNSCPTLRVIPRGAGGGCCPDGQNWNGSSCGSTPAATCPAGTTGTPPDCLCPDGSKPTGKALFCKPPKKPPVLTCPDDSHVVGTGTLAFCQCNKGTAGKPGECKKPVINIPLVCPDDSHVVGTGKRAYCQCDQGTAGKPGQCKKPDLTPCPPDSNGRYMPACTCKPGTQGDPGNCQPIINLRPCPPDSKGAFYPFCKCKRGTEGTPGQCQGSQPACPPDSTGDPGHCACKPNTHGTPGNCEPCAPGMHELRGTCYPDSSTNDNAPNIEMNPNFKIYKNKNLIPLLRTCPEGTQGTYPDCSEVIR